MPPDYHRAELSRFEGFFTLHTRPAKAVRRTCIRLHVLYLEQSKSLLILFDDFSFSPMPHWGIVNLRKDCFIPYGYVHHK